MNTYMRFKEQLNVAIEVLKTYAERGDEEAQVAIRDIEVMGYKRLPASIRIKEGLAWCRCCKKYIPIENFNKDKSRSFGLQAYCKECNKKIAREYRQRKKQDDQ